MKRVYEECLTAAKGSRQEETQGVVCEEGKGGPVQERPTENVENLKTETIDTFLDRDDYDDSDNDHDWVPPRRQTVDRNAFDNMFEWLLLQVIYISVSGHTFTHIAV